MYRILQLHPKFEAVLLKPIPPMKVAHSRPWFRLVSTKFVTSFGLCSVDTLLNRCQHRTYSHRGLLSNRALWLSVGTGDNLVTIEDLGLMPF